MAVTRFPGIPESHYDAELSECISRANQDHGRTAIGSHSTHDGAGANVDCTLVQRPNMHLWRGMPAMCERLPHQRR